VAVTLCLSSEEEEQVLRGLGPRLIRPIVPPEEETLPIELAPDKDDQILPGGPLLLKAITPEHLIVIADAPEPAQFGILGCGVLRSGAPRSSCTTQHAAVISTTIRPTNGRVNQSLAPSTATG
jgi:hypothetical protein